MPDISNVGARPIAALRRVKKGQCAARQSATLAWPSPPNHALAYFLQLRDDEGQLAMYAWQGDLWPW